MLVQTQYTLVILFFNDTATTEIYTLSLHDALPISGRIERLERGDEQCEVEVERLSGPRSEEHTSELQSHLNLGCRLLLEKKKNLCAGGTNSVTQNELSQTHQRPLCD